MQEIAEYLDKLGLNKYEKNVFIFLLNRGPKKAVEIADYAGVPRPRIYDILSKMIRDGLVFKETTNPAIFGLIDPSISFDLLAAKFAEEYEKKAEIIRGVKGKLKNVRPVWDMGHFNSIYGKKNIKVMHKNMLNIAERKVTEIITAFSTHHLYGNGPNKFLLDIINKGIKFDLVLHVEREDTKTLSLLNQYMEIRHLPNDPMLNVCLVDDKILLLAWKSDKGKDECDVGVQITGAFVDLFSKKLLDMLLPMFKVIDEQFLRNI